MVFANNLDPDEALQKFGPHLRSKLFDNHISYTCNGKHLDENENLKEKMKIIA